MKKSLRSIPFAGLLLVGVIGLTLTAGAARASDESFGRLVQRWKGERELLMRKMTQAWLRGEKPQSLKGDMLTLSQIESGLASTPGAVLYIASVEDPNDLNASIGAVVRAYLRQRGGSVDTADFLRGKSFNVTTQDAYGTPDASRVRTRPLATVSEGEGDVAAEEAVSSPRGGAKRTAPGTAWGD